MYGRRLSSQWNGFGSGQKGGQAEGKDGEKRFGSGHWSVKLLFCDLKHE